MAAEAPPKPRKKPPKLQSGPPTLTRLWKDRPRIGADNSIHRPGLDGAFFSDLASIREPVMVQEVYVLDPFLRALAEFRSPQSLGDEAVPVPCHEDELRECKTAALERIDHFDL